MSFVEHLKEMSQDRSYIKIDGLRIGDVFVDTEREDVVKKIENALRKEFGNQVKFKYWPSVDSVIKTGSEDWADTVVPGSKLNPKRPKKASY